jgi:hypothetical protein
MRRVDHALDPDTAFPGRIARAAALIGLLTVTGCGPAGVGSVDFAKPPDLNKIGNSRPSEPEPGTRPRPAREPSKKDAQFIPG